MIVRWLMANTDGDRRAHARRQDLLRDDRSAGVPRRRRPAARRGPADQVAKATTPRRRRCSRPTASTSIPTLRDEVVARVDQLQLPSYTGFVMPKLEAVTDAAGEITDVTISYPLDLTDADARILGGDAAPACMTYREGTAEPAEIAKKILLCGLCVLCGFFFSSSARAQDEPPAAPRTTRLAVLQAEDRRAPTPRDLAIIRSGLHGGDAQTVRVAVRALGRLERPALIRRHRCRRCAMRSPRSEPKPRTRSRRRRRDGKRVQGSGLRAQGSRRRPRPRSTPLRAARGASEGRGRARRARGALRRARPPAVRRTRRRRKPPSGRWSSMAGRAETVDRSARRGAGSRGAGAHAAQAARAGRGRGRGAAAPGDLRRRAKRSTGARVRRLALEALTTRRRRRRRDAGRRRARSRRAGPPAGAARRGRRGAAGPGRGAAQRPDRRPRGRFADRRGSRRCAACARATTPTSCAATLAATGDRDAHVALFALDQLGGCGSAPDAVAALERTVSDLSGAGAARGWHRAAHALVALATAPPDARRRGAAAVHRLAHLAAAAVRGAGRGGARRTRDALEQLGARRGRQRRAKRRSTGCASWPATTPTRSTSRSSRATAIRSLRAAALALDGTPHPDTAIPALQGRVAAAGRGGTRQLARRARCDRQDADQPRAIAPKKFAAAGRRRTISTPRICAGSPRRARASRFAASAPSSSRCSRRRRRRRCCASRTSPRPATTTASPSTASCRTS